LGTRRADHEKSKRPGIGRSAHHGDQLLQEERNKLMPPKIPQDRRLLATMTNEPFQPVRLYYAIPDRAFVTKKLRGLKCMVEVPPERCWQWLFHAEAASLRFFAGYDEVPVDPSTFAAERAIEPDVPIPAPPSYRDKWRRRG
jgi:hypothetical protein